jgi:hypothetical protein
MRCQHAYRRKMDRSPSCHRISQMYRDPILSRITKTEPNELGLEFYLRITVFGALPVIAWFAYQFPEIGGSLLRFVRPGLSVLK